MVKFCILVTSALFYWNSCFCEPLEIYSFNVFQGNFNIIKHGEKALVYDCGTNRVRVGAVPDIIYSQNFETCLRSLREIRILVSHHNCDHYNLISWFVSYIQMHNSRFPTERINIACPQRGRVIENGYCLVGSQTAKDDIAVFLDNSLGNDVTINILKNDAGDDEHDKNVVLLLVYAGWKVLLTGDISEKSMKVFFNEAPDIFCGIHVLYFPHHGSMAEGRLLYNLLDVYAPNDHLPLIGIISSDPNARTSEQLPKKECFQYTSLRGARFDTLMPHRVEADGWIAGDFDKPLYITSCAKRAPYYQFIFDNQLLQLLEGDNILLSYIRRRD